MLPYINAIRRAFISGALFPFTRFFRPPPPREGSRTAIHRRGRGRPPPTPGPTPPDQSDHRGKKRNLPSGKSCRAIFGTPIFGSQTPSPPSNTSLPPPPPIWTGGLVPKTPWTIWTMAICTPYATRLRPPVALCVSPATQLTHTPSRYPDALMDSSPFPLRQHAPVSACPPRLTLFFSDRKSCGQEFMMTDLRGAGSCLRETFLLITSFCLRLQPTSI